MSDHFRQFVEKVRNHLDIVEVIGADLELRPCGKVMKGLSPFNQEKHPSFVVWPATQSWHDFSGGGGRGGDVFTYIEERDGCGFKEAVFRAAERAGVRRPEQNDTEYLEELRRMAERSDVERLLTKAAAYYHAALPVEIRDKWFRDHYALTDATIDELSLGWADGQLYEHFTGQLGIRREHALRTGLFVVVGGQPRDFFERRLVFPYWLKGRVVYFAARATEETPDEEWEKAKYKKLLTRSERHSYVSPTVGNDYFYNEDAARGADQLLITEGITDCIAARQAGASCISPATTRFRDKDIPKLLSLTQHARRVILCNDAEESGAGENGAVQTAAALHRAGRNVRLVLLPRPDSVDKVDLNDYLKSHSPEDLERICSRAKPYVEYLVDKVPASVVTSELAEKLEPVLEGIAVAGELEQEALIGIVARRFELPRRVLKRQVAGAKLLLQSRRRKAESNSHPQGDGDEASIDGDLGSEVECDADAVRGQIYADAGHYYEIDQMSRRKVVLSSFRVQPTERVACSDGELLAGDIVPEHGAAVRHFLFPRSAWHSRRDFIRALPSPDLQWTGNDDQVQGLLRLLSAKELPRRQGVTTLGYADTPKGPRWVSPSMVIGPEGVVENDILYASPSSGFSQRLKYQPATEAETASLAAAVLPALLDLNTPAVTLTIIGWFFASAFKPRLMKLLGHFPILFVWGTQGSGKTSLIKEIFWPLFGVAENSDPISATETEFALIKLLSSTTSIPVFIDEYKPRDMPRPKLDRLNRILRRIYCGETEERGRPDLTVASYPLSAPVCLAGEARPEGDSALLERIIAVSPSKNQLSADLRHQRAFHRLRKYELARLAVPYIRLALGRDTGVDLARAQVLANQLMCSIPHGSDMPPRCRDNVAVMVFGVMMFEAFARASGVPLPDQLDLEAAVAACAGQVLECDGATKDAFDGFLEALSAYAQMGLLEEGVHYAMINGRLCLHLPSCYQAYLKERHGRGLADDTNGLLALRRIAREKVERQSYIKEIDRRVDMRGRFTRTVVVEPEKIPNELEFDAFPITKNRCWGGDHGEAASAAR